MKKVTRKHYIVRTNSVLGGAPVIVGTRIPAERLRALIEQGYTEQRLKQEFPHVGVTKLRGALAELIELGLQSVRAA